MSLLSSGDTLYSPDTSESCSVAPTLNLKPRKTGRPKQWTVKRLWKLSRLYSYSDLPRSDIPAALQEKNWTPSEDAVAKHSKALFGTDPRWLHLRPKNRDDMDKRIEAFKDCQKPKGRAGIDAEGSIRSDEDQETLLNADPSSSWTDASLDDLLELLAQPSSTPTPLIVHDSSGYNPAPIHPTLRSAGDSVFQDESVLPTLARQATHSLGPGPLKLFPYTNGAGKATSDSRSTLSTHISTSSIKRRLPRYSTQYLKKIVRLLDTHSLDDAAPTSIITRSESASSTENESNYRHRYSGLSTGGVGNSKSTDNMFPNTFLVLDRLIHRQGICIPGLKPHDNKICWCAVSDEIGTTELEVMSPEYLGDENLDFNSRDDFGNTVLHLLAARGSSWDLILEVIDLGADVNAKNVAGQNFLHVLEHSAFQTLVKDLSQGRLTSILQKLDVSRFEFNHCDLFGRSFLHNLLREAQSLSEIPFPYLADFKNIPSTRDAFGWIPNPHRRAQVGLGDVSQITGLLAQNPQSQPIVDNYRMPLNVPKSPLTSTPMLSTKGVKKSNRQSSRVPAADIKTTSVKPDETLSDDELWTQARLIETARLAASAPWIEESEGRNGLQCLAEVALDIHIDNGTVVASNSTKRKRNQPDVLPGSLRLNLRYQLVEGLVSAGVGVNNYDDSGSTVLMSFVTHLPDGEDDKALASVLELLLHKGANIHMRNRKGETALHIAVRLGRKVATRVLLDHGANVHARTTEGIGVLLLARAHYLKARNDPSLYASIIVCMAMVIDRGGVASPTIVQEWSCR
ncbi:Ankyrin repeat-containing protein [Glarea lozoyensis ATCC 20868]|uniref:Ankyrin repeat-containing protein n=1 Tax=Glarea lozoyensis (strain ATCC 20868 / MF5171) TaxID=1116229 RepID=S3CXH1_GLAL2|nr:Ankyrin repeat-containing protein [Glarea lozoyensis ATCC 20868]EPE30285.1 Ankyrin repeat-containing protein [Glarea lozoyensis ATCC 20868]